MSYITDRKRAEGQGSAQAGTSHFIEQRVSALALVVLLVLFVFIVGPLIGKPIDEVEAGFKNYWVSMIAAATVIAVTIHSIQGLQVVIEDYISHKGLRVLALFKLKAGLPLLAFAALWAIAKLAFA